MAMCNFVSVLFAALSLTTIIAAPTEKVISAVTVPAECKDQQFCSVRPEGYDLIEEKINSALPEFLVKFENGYNDRYGDEDEEPVLSPKDDWHNCPYVTKRESMFLYRHGSGNDTKIDVFVQTKLFRQFIDVVTCATEHIDLTSDEQCFQGMGISAFHMKSRCETSSAKRTLYVYDFNTNKVVQKSYDVPACCTCRVSY